MNRRPAALLLLMLALSACAEGGTRGSGITTLLGNVQAVQTAARPRQPSSGMERLLADVRAFFDIDVAAVARARTAVEGIDVSVEGTGAHDRTDANGEFTVQGHFDGSITVVFELPEGGGQARIPLTVPAGGRLTLNNVTIDPEQEEASAETQDVDFDGTIIGIYCQSLTIRMVSSQEAPGDTDQYTVRLDTSSVRDVHGNTLACEDIPEGARASVQGMVNSDGTFGNATVQLED
jgi:hypothetical protein